MEFLVLAIIAIAVAALLAVVVTTEPRRLLGHSFTDYPDDIQTAAHRFIGMTDPWPSYLGGTVGQMGEYRNRIARKRREATEITNTELRDCVIAWLDYYENTAAPKLEKELREQTSRKELDAYEAKQAKSEKRVKQILSAAKD